MRGGGCLLPSLDLGYVPFVEDETGDAFVMGQEEFLRRYLVVKRKDALPVSDTDEKRDDGYDD